MEFFYEAFPAPDHMQHVTIYHRSLIFMESFLDGTAARRRTGEERWKEDVDLGANNVVQHLCAEGKEKARF